MTVTNVGFIGLGNIGKPMAENLLGKNFSLKVFDVAEEPVKSLEKKGALVAASIKEFSDCQVLGLCVRDDNDVENLLYGEEGLLENLKEGAVIAIHSTVTRDNILKWHNEAKAKNIVLVDAPITGGAEGAQNATLCYMVGADDVTFAKVDSVFGLAAKKVLNAGPVGSGIVLKLANNLMTYAAFAAVSEATHLVSDNNVDFEKLLEVGETNSVITAQMNRFIANREKLAPACTEEEMFAFFGPFAGLAEKDLDHALTLAGQNNTNLDCTKAVRGKIRSVFLRQD